MQLVTDVSASVDPLQLAQRYFSDMDLVLVEGYSQAGCSKIEVLRAACCSVMRCEPAGLLALVTDVQDDCVHLTRFGLDDIDRIAQFIVARLAEQRTREAAT